MNTKTALVLSIMTIVAAVLLFAIGSQVATHQVFGHHYFGGFGGFGFPGCGGCCGFGGCWANLW
jgi:hypothetical protein